ncbi:MAG TPA: hypothetical protein VHD38_00900 [Candidatus Paceibacterota bacterium]|jgi:hypothetical protein|nr:hypothetical protein [Candidatus Paceibacterota bacterium]
MSNVVQLFKKPSLCALRKVGTLVLHEFAHEPARRRTVLNEIVRIKDDEPTPPDRNPEIRQLVVMLARSFDRECVCEA